MKDTVYSSMQLREVFHLEFLRWLGKKLQPGNYVLKGGVNLRLFFNSFRYSEDMDLDAAKVRVETLQDHVMKILRAQSFQDSLKLFGVEKVVPPDISKAKQTETTQRFKVHLITSSGEDLFTKVEFSRRGFKGEVEIRPVADAILRAYKMAPLLVPHYGIESAVIQKIEALATRAAVQARDVFDLYLLSSQYKTAEDLLLRQSAASEMSNNPQIAKAKDNVLGISFEQFQDTVVSYLILEDQAVYRTSASWDAIKSKVIRFIDETSKRHG